MLVNSENYINIQGWMVTELGLKGNELIIYAVVYSFSNTKDKFFGSLQYLEEWTNSTKQGVLNSIKSLIAKGLLIKTEVGKGSQKKCRYEAMRGGDVKTATHDKPSKEAVKTATQGKKETMGSKLKKIFVPHKNTEVEVFYKQAVKTNISYFERNWLNTRTDKYGEELLICVIEEAAMCNKCTLKYMDAILKACMQDGRNTAEKFRNAKNKRKENIQVKANTFNSYEQRDYTDEELEEIIARKNKLYCRPAPTPAPAVAW